MEKERLELALEEDIGKATMIQEITPSICYVATIGEDTTAPNEYYIAEKDCPELSKEAKEYGKPLDHNPEYICFVADTPEYGRMVIEYEVNRYLKKHGLPTMEGDRLLTIADYGREHEPEYFGDYPAPLATSRGLTMRYVRLSSGIFLIETDRLETILAVCYPIWQSELSDYAKIQGEKFAYDQLCGIENTEGYLFFPETSAGVALFELWVVHKQLEQSGRINPLAMMNAIWKHHPVYAASHNVREQAGLNDGMALLAKSLGISPELTHSSENVISIFSAVGTDYLNR